MLCGIYTDVLVSSSAAGIRSTHRCSTGILSHRKLPPNSRRPGPNSSYLPGGKVPTHIGHPAAAVLLPWRREIRPSRGSLGPERGRHQYLARRERLVATHSSRSRNPKADLERLS